MIFAHNRNVCDNREVVSTQFRDYRDSLFCETREYRCMNDGNDDIREWLRGKLEERGHGAKQDLARFLGFTRPDPITRMLNTDPTKELRQIKHDEYTKMREFFGETGEAHSVIPGLGYIGAGAEVLPDFEQVPPEGLFEVSVPFPLPAEMGAFEVRGDSMRPVFRDGHVIIVYLSQRKPLEAFYGHEAAVRTADGRRFIKTIMKGTQGRVTLSSWNADPIEDQRLEWIGEIFAILPRSAVTHIGNEAFNSSTRRQKTG